MDFLKNNALTLIGLTLGLIFWLISQSEFRRIQDEKAELIMLMRGGSYGMERIADNIVASKSEIAFLKKQNAKLLVGNSNLRAKMHSLECKIEAHVVTVIDSVVLPADSAEIIRTATANMLKLPYANTYKDQWLSFRQTIDSEGRNVIRNITIPDSLQVFTYTAKRKFKELGKPRSTSVAIQTSNPYTKVTKMRSVVIKHERKWYEKPIVWGLLGFSAGFAVNMSIK